MARMAAQAAPTLFSHSGSLAADAVLSGSLAAQGYSRARGVFRSDVASVAGSGVRIQQSIDGGVTFDVMSSSALATACAASTFDVPVVGNLVKFTWANGNAAASTARVLVYLLPVT